MMRPGAECYSIYTLQIDDHRAPMAIAEMHGAEVNVMMIDTWMEIAHITHDGIQHVVPLKWLKKSSLHKFPNTGARRSFCDTCGRVGHFNWRSGCFEPE